MKRVSKMSAQLFVTVLCCALVLAQNPQPATEVYLVDLTRDSEPAAHPPIVNISNSPGYDNQPSFTPDGQSVLFTSNRDGKQTDIYRYDIATSRLVQLTHTAENEYSPLVMPGGRGFSVVHGDEQSLWQFDLFGMNGKLVYQHQGKIGYHVWLDSTHLGIFVLGAAGQPSTLQVADIASGSTETIATGIGRSILLRPGTNQMSFVVKTSGQPSMIKVMDVRTHLVSDLVETVKDSEDCAWDPETGRLLISKDTKNIGWLSNAKGWIELADLASAGIKNITRLAVNPDKQAGAARRLAIVGEPAAR